MGMIEIVKLGDGRLVIYRPGQVNSGLVLTKNEIQELKTTLAEVLKWQED